MACKGGGDLLLPGPSAHRIVWGDYPARCDPPSLSAQDSPPNPSIGNTGGIISESRLLDFAFDTIA